MADTFTPPPGSAGPATARRGAATEYPLTWRLLTNKAAFRVQVVGQSARLVKTASGDAPFMLVGGDRSAAPATVYRSQDAVTWYAEAVPFLGRAFPSVMNIGNNGVLVFGGNSNIGVYDDLWFWAGDTWAPIPWSKPAPPPRTRAATISTQGGSPLGCGWLIGGYPTYSTVSYPDVWRTDNGGSTWTPLTLEAPWGHIGEQTAIYDGRTLWLFGGLRSGQYLAEVWASDDGGVTWTRRPDAPWAPRSGAVAELIPQGILFFGGMNQHTTSDCWILTPDGTWIEVTWDVPFSHASFPHANTGRSLIFAAAGAYAEEVWALDYAPEG